MKETVSTTWFEALMDSAERPVALLTVDGQVDYINHCFLELIGRTDKEVIGQKCLDFIAPQSKACLQMAVQSILHGEGNAKYHVDLEILHKTDEKILISWDILRLPDGRGDTAGIGLVGRKAAQEVGSSGVLRQSESVLRSILDNEIDGIVTIDECGHIISFNKSAERLFGYHACEVLDRNVSMLMPSPYKENHDQFLTNYLTTGNAKIIGKGREVLGLKKDGTTFPFFLRVGREIKLDDGQRGFVGVVRDLSMEKRIEDQLRRSQRMESIGTLAGGIAHDFNNILGGIMGYVELMLEDAEKDSYLYEDLTEMLRACNRGRDLILQILTFSRQEKPKREPMFLHPVIKECLNLLRASIPTTIEIRKNIEVNGPAIVADPTQIHQVIMNLGTNAYHAMREKGGVMSVTLKTVKVDEHFRLANLELPFGTYLHLLVKDNGVGMDEKTLARIYDPFFTTKPLGEGTGMGLSVVLGIMQSHEGDIIALSEPGKGSEFHLFFPVSGNMTDPIIVGVEEEGSGGARILLVDDDEMLLKVQSRILSRVGYRITTRENGTDALTEFERDPDAFDLVITDQTMPGLTGLEFIAGLHESRPDLPVILTTGFKNIISPETARALKIRNILTKPVSKNDLIQSIQLVLKSEY